MWSTAVSPPPARDDENLTTDELAWRWRMTRKTIERKARAGEIPAFRSGRRWLFPLTKIERFERMKRWDSTATGEPPEPEPDRWG